MGSWRSDRSGLEDGTSDGTDPKGKGRGGGGIQQDGRGVEIADKEKEAGPLCLLFPLLEAFPSGPNALASHCSGLDSDVISSEHLKYLVSPHLPF